MKQKSLLKTLILIVPFFILVSCGGNEEKDASTLKKELEELEKQKSELEKQIADITDQIKALDSSVLNNEKVSVVKAAPVEVGSFKNLINVTGSASSNKNVTLSSETQGIILKVYKNEGDNVKKGDLLVKVDDDILRNQIAEVQTRLDLAKKLYERQENLWNQNIGSEVQYLQAKNNYESSKKSLGALQAQLDKTSIKAPFSGQLDEVFINEGETVAPGMPIARVVNLNDIQVESSISETYLGQLNKGQNVIVEFKSINFRDTLEVGFVSNFVNPDNRTFKVEIPLDNKDGRIKPNLLANIYFNNYETDSAVLVPTKLVQESGKGDFIYIVGENEEGKSIALKKYIEIGYSYKGKTEVKSGIKADDVLIVQGFRDLDDRERISIL